ncbi:MAG: iron ABC transporter permease, partial [Gammaproteobacteria bacterium]|nr:iron ABC transporter permease [Gammaproteobacteria bacterium]
MSQWRPARNNRWRGLAALIALPVLMPCVVVFGSVFSPETQAWQHLLDYVLAEVLVNTLWLVAGVAIITGVVGTSLAWLTAISEFPGRRFFSWALMLPIAVPGYVMAFVLLGL